MSADNCFSIVWQTDSYASNADALQSTRSVAPVKEWKGLLWLASIEKLQDHTKFVLRVNTDFSGAWECEATVNFQYSFGNGLIHNAIHNAFESQHFKICFNESSREYAKHTPYSWATFTIPPPGINRTAHLYFHINVTSMTRTDLVGSIVPELDSIDLSKFASRNESNNVTLLFGDKSIVVSKEYLAFQSPVFGTMFFGEFEEKDKKEVPIKEVEYEEFVALLLVIFPKRDEITDATVEVIARLADRFQIEEVSEAVEKHLLNSSTLRIGEKMKLADDYRFEKLRDQCLRSFKNVNELKLFQNSPLFDGFSDKMKVAICERIIRML